MAQTKPVQVLVSLRTECNERESVGGFLEYQTIAGELGALPVGGKMDVLQSKVQVAQLILLTEKERAWRVGDFSGPPSATPARYWQKSSWRKVPVSAGRPESARLPVEPGRWRALSSLPFRVRRSCRRDGVLLIIMEGIERCIWH